MTMIAVSPKGKTLVKTMMKLGFKGFISRYLSTFLFYLTIGIFIGGQINGTGSFFFLCALVFICQGLDLLSRYYVELLRIAGSKIDFESGDFILKE